MECCCYLRNMQDLLSDGKTPYERRFGMPFNGPVIPFRTMVEYHPFSAKDQSRLHQFGSKVLPGICLSYVLYAENLERRHCVEEKVQRAMHRETWSSVEENCETSAVSWKSTDVLGRIRRVRFTTATLRQAKPRENKGPSLGIIQVKTSHQRSPYAVKFEDRSQEETERQERCATDVWMMPAASKMKPEDREFVVDVGASMHMVSKKDLNSAELETVKVSKNQTTVMTANGEVLSKEEATVFVWELDLFVTVVLLADTPAVLSLRKLCEDHGYNYHWTSGRKPHLLRNGRK